MDTLLKNTKSLYDLMCETLNSEKLLKRYHCLDDIILSDAKSADFIRDILDDPEFKEPNSKAVSYQTAKRRARHSAITFLMGYVLSEFCGFAEEVNQTFDFIKAKKSLLWLITSLYHDVGYFSNYISEKELKYEKVFLYQLLTDAYEEKSLMPLGEFSEFRQHCTAYTYDEIRSYDDYARRFNSDNRIKHPDHTEAVDHGILGGIIAFNRLIKKNKRIATKEQLFLIKTAALTIAQHNIFKSESEETDKEYPEELLKKLGHDSSFRIRKDTPLLLWLCMVDTTECVKRLGRVENENKYLETKTVLQNLFLSVTKDMVIVDCSRLHRRVLEKKDPDLEKAYNRYVDGILGFGKWTIFKATRYTQNEDVILITLEEREHV